MTKFAQLQQFFRMLPALLVGQVPQDPPHFPRRFPVFWIGGDEKSFPASFKFTDDDVVFSLHGMVYRNFGGIFLCKCFPGGPDEGCEAFREEAAELVWEMVGEVTAGGST